MQKYVSIKSNNTVENISDEAQDGYIGVQVPDSKMKNLAEYPSTCWVEKQSDGTYVIHIPDDSQLPQDDVEKLQDDVKSLQQEYAQLPDLSNLQNNVKTIQQDLQSNNIDDIKAQVANLAKGVVTSQQALATLKANQNKTTTQSNQSTTQNNQANNSQQR